MEGAISPYDTYPYYRQVGSTGMHIRSAPQWSLRLGPASTRVVDSPHKRLVLCWPRANFQEVGVRVRIGSVFGLGLALTMKVY